MNSNTRYQARIVPILQEIQSADGYLRRERLHELEVAGSLQTGNAQLIDPATLPLTAATPRPKMAAAIAAFVGLLVGALFALALGMIPPLRVGLPVSSANGASAGVGSSPQQEREREREHERA